MTILVWTDSRLKLTAEHSVHVITTDSCMQILCQLICKNGIFSSEVTKIVFMKRMATLLNSETVKDLLDQEFLDKE